MLTAFEKANQCSCGRIVMLIRADNGVDLCMGSHTTGDRVHHTKDACRTIDQLDELAMAPRKIAVAA